MSLTAVKDFIEANDNFAIIGHVNPDGDCVGSCMGLWHTIRGLGKQAKIISPDYVVEEMYTFNHDEVRERFKFYYEKFGEFIPNYWGKKE